MPKPTDTEKDAATVAAEQAAAEAKAKADADAAASHPDPVKEALEQERAKRKPELERAAFSLKKNAERLKEIGGDPAEVLGFPVAAASSGHEDDTDDDKPLTRGDFRRMREAESQRTALELAEEIPNEDERALAKEYLQSRIRPSGNPQSDLEAAMALVNSVKNRQVAEEIERKSRNQPRRFSSGSGSPTRTETSFEASEEEKMASRLAHIPPNEQQKWIEDRREGKPVVFGTAAKKKREAESKNR